MEIREPFRGELPSGYADYLGLYYTSKVSEEHKKNLGQFFTPIEIAKFMAEFCSHRKSRVRILDPGCGLGILSCALTEIIANNKEVKEVELVAFETDLEIIHLAERSFSYLREWLVKKNIIFTYFLCANDFILHNSAVLENKSGGEDKFDIVISNPPYFKISKNHPVAITAKSIIYGQTNIYTIFLIISAKLLVENGQLIFITPRSFTSGNYFRLFREIFFSIVNLKKIHLFRSRRNAFQRDKVLQENVIFSAFKKREENNQQLILPFDTFSNNYSLEISISNGLNDLNEREVKDFNFKSLVNLESFQKILHLPTSINDERAIKVFKTWENSLNSYDIQISTGPVVAFRSVEFISEILEESYVPLIWLHNVNKMHFEWPKEYSKGKLKGQYIKVCKESYSRLLPNRNYIFLRRFSSKDDSSRLIACPFLKKWIPNTKIGVENHLNYIYKPEGELSETEVMGIAAILNSRLFDLYFRTFNGNINVSATELREMPLPDLTTIKRIGSKVLANKIKTQHLIDQILYGIFKIELD